MLVAVLVEQPPLFEGRGEGHVLPVDRGQRRGPDQLGELPGLPRPRERRQELGGQVQVVLAGAAGPAPLRISRDSEDSGSTGG